MTAATIKVLPSHLLRVSFDTGCRLQNHFFRSVQQIIDKKYSLRFSGKAGEKAKYTVEILAVGIGYNKKTKKHQCRVITLRKGTLY